MKNESGHPEKTPHSFFLNNIEIKRNMDGLELTIISPEKKLFQGEVRRVTLPGIMGSFTILPQHAPVVSSLQAGKVTYVKADGTEETRQINGGFIEMNSNHVSVCIN